jgi:hypothetical protein
MLAVARWNIATPGRVRMQRTVRPGVRLALGFARGLTIALVPRRRRRARGEFIPLSIQIRRRPATPFRTCDSICRTTGSSAPMQAINHLPARDVSNYKTISI